jgi:CHAD domain-containing protein
VEEHEHKLLAGPNFRLPDAEVILAGIGTGSVEDIEQEASYFDTPDLRLSRAGVSLRYRSDDGWTVKLPEAHHDDAFLRTEHTFAGELGLPPPAAIELVRAWARSGTLGLVARMHTSRRRIQVRDQTGRPLGEIDDDRVTGTALRQRAFAFHEIEFELAADADAELVDRLVERIREAGAGTGRSMPKIARALGPDAEQPPDVRTPDQLGGGARVDQLVRVAIASSVRQLIDHDPRIRLGPDPEAVHKARVATRRLRSDLRSFRPLLEPSWSEPLREELRWLGATLGRVRDADVLLGRLEEKGGALGDELGSEISELTDRLAAARQRDRDELLEAMRSERYSALLDRLVQAARAPKLRKGVKAGKASKVVRTVTRHPWKRLRKAVHRLPEDPSDRQLHEVRKRAKQARYAYEAVAPIAGSRAHQVARRLTDLQDVLGDHQDAVVATRWLRDAASDSPPSVSFAAGMMAGAFREDRLRLRTEWSRPWRRAQRAHRRL